jgi:8-oxo-dGTP pyrophosphatase MutT (NUDIX family)
MRPVPAATVLLVRDGADGLEVLMLERRADSGFVPGAFVFPGGALDPGDRTPATHARCDGPAEPVASRRLGIAADGLAHHVAALREAFEEAGVLLADGPDGRPVAPTLVDALQPERHRLDDGHADLATLAAAHDLTYATARLRPFAHWITPEGAPRRYDTRFFVAAAPDGQTASPCDREVVAARWIAPAAALDEFSAGRFPLILPTERCLRAVASAPSAAELLALLDGELARPDGPRHVADHGGRRLSVAADLEGSPA